MLAEHFILCIYIHLGFGKYGLKVPIRVKIEVLLTLPTIGIAVSKGLLATKVPDAENGAGLVSARNGAVPVAVGPCYCELMIPTSVDRGPYLENSRG